MNDFWKKLGRAMLRLYFDIGFATITIWIPVSYFMNSFVDTNKCALVYSFCQYYNLSKLS